MSFDLPAGKPRPNKAGGGMFFLIILAVGAYLIFSNLGKAPQPAGGVLDRDNRLENVESDYDRQAAKEREYQREREGILGDNDATAQGKQMPSTGGSGAASDWDMQDVATDRNNPTTSNSNLGKTENGDWTIEDVDAKKKDNSQFQFSNKPGSTTKPENDDWAIEGVDKTKKTESGDWAIEETTKKKDK